MMFKRIQLLPAILLCFCLEASAHTELKQNPWTLSGLVGGSFQHKMFFNYTDAVTAAAETTTVSYGAGYHIAAAVGYEYCPMRFEFEILRAREPRRNVTTTGSLTLAGSSGETSLTAAMINAIYHFEHYDSQLRPYVGLGLGTGRLRTQVSIPTFTNIVTGSRAAFSYQGLLGAHLQLSPSVATFMDYRYIRSSRQNFDIRDPLTGVGHLGISSLFHTHTFNLGAVVRF